MDLSLQIMWTALVALPITLFAANVYWVKHPDLYELTIIDKMFVALLFSEVGVAAISFMGWVWRVQ